MAIGNPFLHQSKASHNRCYDEPQGHQDFMERVESFLVDWFQKSGECSFCPGKKEYEAEIYCRHKHLHKTKSPNTSPQQEQENITENQECPEV